MKTLNSTFFVSVIALASVFSTNAFAYNIQCELPVPNSFLYVVADGADGSLDAIAVNINGQNLVGANTESWNDSAYSCDDNNVTAAWTTKDGKSIKLNLTSKENTNKYFGTLTVSSAGTADVVIHTQCADSESNLK
ncbi:MAG TPA: hypothetical protein VN132_05620 [Bdellovibrio sp.]|nr:hypothetical protein [Bdellovibrio sp.]